MQINLFSGSLPLLLTATTYQIWYILIGSFGQKESILPLSSAMCVLLQCLILLRQCCHSLPCLQHYVMGWHSACEILWKRNSTDLLHLMTCSFQSMFRPFLVATMTSEMQTVKSKQQETSCHVKKFLVYHRCTYCDYRLKGRYLSLIFKLHVSWTDFKCSDLWLSPLFRLFAQLLHGRLQLARWQQRKAAVKCDK